MHAFFKKYHFYKQRQAEMSEKSSKSYATPWAWTFAIWKSFTFFNYFIIQE